MFKDISKLVLYFSTGEKAEIDYKDENMLLAVNVEKYSTENSDFVELVFNNYKGVKSVEELSLRCGYNTTKTFTRHFICAMHTTPKQWLISIKRSEVMYYLKHTGMSVTEIASILGFSSISHLNQFCNKQIGQNPTEIRM